MAHNGYPCSRQAAQILPKIANKCGGYTLPFAPWHSLVGPQHVRRCPPKQTKVPRVLLVCVRTVVSEAVTDMLGRVEFSTAIHAD